MSGVRVMNGTVQGFDAGIAILSGSGNTVQGKIIRDNINDGLGGSCDLGDGIAVLNSDNNRIEGNAVSRATWPASACTATSVARARAGPCGGE